MNHKKPILSCLLSLALFASAAATAEEPAKAADTPEKPVQTGSDNIAECTKKYDLGTLTDALTKAQNALIEEEVNARKDGSAIVSQSKKDAVTKAQSARDSAYERFTKCTDACQRAKDEYAKSVKPAIAVCKRPGISTDAVRINLDECYTQFQNCRKPTTSTRQRKPKDQANALAGPAAVCSNYKNANSYAAMKTRVESIDPKVSKLDDDITALQKDIVKATKDNADEQKAILKDITDLQKKLTEAQKTLSEGVRKYNKDKSSEYEAQKKELLAKESDLQKNQADISKSALEASQKVRDYTNSYQKACVDNAMKNYQTNMARAQGRQRNLNLAGGFEAEMKKELGNCMADPNYVEQIKVLQLSFNSTWDLSQKQVQLAQQEVNDLQTKMQAIEAGTAPGDELQGLYQTAMEDKMSILQEIAQKQQEGREAKQAADQALAQNKMELQTKKSERQKLFAQSEDYNKKMDDLARKGGADTEAPKDFKDAFNKVADAQGGDDLRAFCGEDDSKAFKLNLGIGIQ